MQDIAKLGLLPGTPVQAMVVLCLLLGHPYNAVISFVVDDAHSYLGSIDGTSITHGIIKELECFGSHTQNTPSWVRLSANPRNGMHGTWLFAFLVMTLFFARKKAANRICALFMSLWMIWLVKIPVAFARPSMVCYFGICCPWTFVVVLASPSLRLLTWWRSDSLPISCASCVQLMPRSSWATRVMQCLLQFCIKSKLYSEFTHNKY